MNYLRLLWAHLRENPPEPGELVHVEIRHDEDCARLTGGPCKCCPIIESGARVARKYPSNENPK